MRGYGCVIILLRFTISRRGRTELEANIFRRLVSREPQKLVIPGNLQVARGYRVSTLLGGVKAPANSPGELPGSGVTFLVHCSREA